MEIPNNTKKINGRTRAENSSVADPPLSPFDNLNAEEEEIVVLERIEEIPRRMITRTFRIYEDLDASFGKLVDKINTTQTSLLNDILKQYLYWAQYMVAHDSPYLTFGSTTVLSLAESVDDSKLEKIAKETSYEEAIDFIKFRWKKLNFRNIVRYLDLLSSYANVGSIEVSRQNGNNHNGHNGFSNNGGDMQNNNVDAFERYEVSVQHHLGKRWSTFLSMFISNLFTSSLPGSTADYEVSTRSCFVYLKIASTK